MKIVFIMHIALIQCTYINDTSNKIKFILNQFKTYRYNRDINFNEEIEHYMVNALRFFDKTERYGEYLKYLNVSECFPGDISENRTYVKRHVLDGLLIQDDVPNTHWKEYKAVYNKVYSSRRHERAAQSRWRHNLQHVAQHNRLYLEGKLSYSLHLNGFGDWDESDFFRRVLKLIDTVPLFDPAQDHHMITYRKNLHNRVPRTVDWRSKGFRPRREEQWHCGACYAFAVTHAVQAQLYKKHGNWRELSAQQIVDCSFRDGNMGCDGGSLRAAFRYASRAGLIMETRYPYVGKQGRCKYNIFHVRVRPRRWATLPSGDEEAMERALSSIGPLAVAVNAAPFTFQLYRGGIYDDPFCTPWQLNHAMLLVGYTPQYWILLNWWGRRWGEDGYMRIRRGFNRCGVANMATYVEV